MRDLVGLENPALKVGHTMVLGLAHTKGNQTGIVLEIEEVRVDGAVAKESRGGEGRAECYCRKSSEGVALREKAVERDILGEDDLLKGLLRIQHSERGRKSDGEKTPRGLQEVTRGEVV